MASRTIKYILTILLGAQFAFFGAARAIGTDAMVETFDEMGLPEWTMRVVGVFEVAAAVALVASFVRPKLLLPTAAALALLAVAAGVSHVALGDGIADAIPAIMILAQLGLVSWLHTRSSVDRNSTMQVTV